MSGIGDDDEGGFVNGLDGADMGPGKALKPHAQAHLLSPTDKCKVCNEPAAKHVHYGAMTCFSCRAFFRRSIQNKTATTYVCRRSKNCEINIKTRKNCQFCRYSQCLTVGMKPTWVLSEEERQRRFRKNRDKQEQGELKEKKVTRSRGNSLNDLAGDFDLIEGANLTDNLPGLLLLEQAAEEKIPESIPVILEKQEHQQPQTIVKNEQGNFLHSGSELIDHKDEKHYYETLGEPIKNTTFYVKTEPKSNYSPSTYLNNDQKPTLPLTTNVVDPNPSSNFLFVTSSSQFSPVQQSISSPSPYLNCLSQQPPQRQIRPHIQPQIIPQHVHLQPLQPQQHIDPQQHHLQQQPRTTYISSTPSVIVQATPSLVPRYQAPTMEYQPGHDFDVGSFATVGGVVDNDQSFLQNADICQLEPEDYQQQLEDARSFVEDEDYPDTSDDEYDKAQAALRERMLTEPEIHYSQDEENQLKALVAQYQEKYRSVNFGEELIKEMIMCSMFGIPVSTSAAIQGYRLTVERITRIAHSHQWFTNLLKCDQTSLLKENADLLVSLRTAVFFDATKKGVDQVLISMGEDDMETIKTMFTPLLTENSMKHMDYQTFNSIQVIANPLTEQRFDKLMSRVGMHIKDDICMILINYIILFSSDFCNLSDRHVVDQTQDNFTTMLRRYIYGKYPRWKAVCHFANTLESLIYIREMADIKKHRQINQNVRL